MPQNSDLEIIKAILSLLVTTFTLLLTWFVGDRIVRKWNLRQKRKELNLESLHEFHSLYGELKEVIKIWRLVKRAPAKRVNVPSGERWKLLTRACAIESKAEAFVLRLATERELLDGQLLSIGLFRQAVQTLRESIRDDADCPLGSRGAEYRILNQLAPSVAAIVSSDLPKALPSAMRAASQLAVVAGVTAHRWFQKVQSLRTKKWPVKEGRHQGDVPQDGHSSKITDWLEKGAERTARDLQPRSLLLNMRVALQDASIDSGRRMILWPVGCDSSSIGEVDGRSFDARRPLVYEHWERHPGISRARERLAAAGVLTEWFETDEHGVRALCLGVEASDETISAVRGLAKVDAGIFSWVGNWRFDLCFDSYFRRNYLPGGNGPRRWWSRIGCTGYEPGGHSSFWEGR